MKMAVRAIVILSLLGFCYSCAAQTGPVYRKMVMVDSNGVVKAPVPLIVNDVTLTSAVRIATLTGYDGIAAEDGAPGTAPIIVMGQTATAHPYYPRHGGEVRIEGGPVSNSTWNNIQGGAVVIRGGQVTGTNGSPGRVSIDDVQQITFADGTVMSTALDEVQTNRTLYTSTVNAREDLIPPGTSGEQSNLVIRGARAIYGGYYSQGAGHVIIEGGANLSALPAAGHVFIRGGSWTNNYAYSGRVWIYNLATLSFPDGSITSAVLNAATLQGYPAGYFVPWVSYQAHLTNAVQLVAPPLSNTQHGAWGHIAIEKVTTNVYLYIFNPNLFGSTVKGWARFQGTASW